MIMILIQAQHLIRMTYPYFFPVKQMRKHPSNFTSSQNYNLQVKLELLEGATLDCHYRYFGVSLKPTGIIRSKF